MYSIKSQNGLGWKGPGSTHHPNPTPAMGRAAPHQLRLPRAPFNLALSTSRDGAPQLLWAAGPAPHCPFCEKLPLTSNLNLFSFSLKSYSLVLSLSTNCNCPTSFLSGGAPGLDTVLQMGSHKGRAVGDNPFLLPTGHLSCDPAQDTVGLPSCKPRCSLM